MRDGTVGGSLWVEKAALLKCFPTVMQVLGLKRTASLIKLLSVMNKSISESILRFKEPSSLIIVLVLMTADLVFRFLRAAFSVYREGGKKKVVETTLSR